PDQPRRLRSGDARDRHAGARDLRRRQRRRQHPALHASLMLILTVRDLTVRFGGIIALESVSFDVDEGQIVGLIGPNGAGKTTLFNCPSRLYTPDRGEVLFRGRPVLPLPPYRIAELGIGRTFQNLAFFPTLTVLQNVMVGLHSRS